MTIGDVTPLMTNAAPQKSLKLQHPKNLSLVDMSTFETPENVVIQDEDGVEYYIEQEDASVDEVVDVDIEAEESVILFVEQQEQEDVDTFTCGTCRNCFTCFNQFIHHKKTPCRQMTDVENLLTTNYVSTEMIDSVDEYQLEEVLPTEAENDANVEIIAENANEPDSNHQVS